MKLYYRAVTQDGKTIRGLIEARDIKEAGYFLRKQGFLPIKITAEGQTSLAKYFPFLKKSAKSNLIFFTRQLSSMLTSGLTLMQALTILRNQIQNQAMADVVNGIIAKVEDGKSLSTAIEGFPQVFSPIYIALIKAAENSGVLDKVLLRLADTLEREDKLRKTIRGALMYPIIVVVMMIAVMVIMLIFVIPQLTVLYDNLGVSLPLPTLIVVTISKFVTNFWPLVIALFIAGFVGFQRWVKKESGKRTVDSLVLKIPIFGKLVSESMMVEFARTLGLLVGTGSLVVDSLHRSAEVVENYEYRDAIMLVSRRVEKGISVGDAMEASPVFPPILVEMVKIGEQTGKLDESLTRASEYFEREVSQTVKTLTTAMEPVIMIILALGVGFLIMAVITPIYSLISSIQ